MKNITPAQEKLIEEFLPRLPEALDKLARSPGLCSKYGEAARARVVEVGSLDRMIDGTIAVYRELVDG